MNARVGLILVSCFIGLFFNASGQTSAHFGEPKFVPEDGKSLLVLGQDLGAVGGLASYTDGYIDNITEHFPAGVTTYTNIDNLPGLFATTNWGAGDVNGSLYTQDGDFDQAVICIGLYMVNSLEKIVNGELDNSITNLGQWIKNSDRPVFLRIGYEFDGPWNSYQPQLFKEAWKYIVHKFDVQDVRNVAYVWQSAGINTPNIIQWYPGDEYVNWLGYSHFDGSNIGMAIKNFSLLHDKPIMIAEATPRRDLKVGDGQQHWNEWFAPLFSSIYSNDKIKMLAYINADWDSQPMWQGQGWGDSRIQVNEIVKELWLGEIAKDSWITGYDGLFDELDYSKWADSPLNTEEGELKSVGYTIFENGNSLVCKSDNSTIIDAVKVFDFQGKMIFTQASINSTEFNISKDTFSTGLVLVVISSADGQTYSKSVLIEN